MDINNLDKIAKALVGFQADMQNVTKDAVNPFFKSKYATLEAILTAAKPTLKKHGLAVVQLPEGDGLRTTIFHESGQHISERAYLVLKDQTPQGQGSAITYMRRYALSAALGIATEDDDDGNEASKAPQTRHTAPGATKPAAAKKETPTELDVQKERISFLLKSLGFKGKTKKEYEDEVFKMTLMPLLPENYNAIAENLAGKLEAKEAVAEQ